MIIINAVHNDSMKLKKKYPNCCVGFLNTLLSVQQIHLSNQICQCSGSYRTIPLT